MSLVVAEDGCIREQRPSQFPFQTALTPPFCPFHYLWPAELPAFRQKPDHGFSAMKLISLAIRNMPKWFPAYLDVHEVLEQLRLAKKILEPLHRIRELIDD